MRGENKKWIYLILLIFWCCFIFKLTSSPVATSSNTSSFISVVLNHFAASNKISLALVQDIDFIIRKIAHLTLFGILGVLFYLTIQRLKYAPIISWILSTVYGLIDEIHQSFVPNRTPLLKDVFIDSLGSALMIILFIFVRIYVNARRFKSI